MSKTDLEVDFLKALSKIYKQETPEVRDARRSLNMQVKHEKLTIGDPGLDSVVIMAQTSRCQNKC